LGGSIELGRVGLLWIGAKFYPTPADFVKEAEELGVSRRVPAIPRGFEVGSTWVFLAHRRAIWKDCSCGSVDDCPDCEGVGGYWLPGVFQVFRPEQLEQVVDGSESDEFLQGLVDRGIQPIIVERDQDQPDLFPSLCF
jgi:hypothetical protein